MLNELKYANNYLFEKIKVNEGLLFEMEKYAVKNNIPIITKEIAEFIKFLIRHGKHTDILEIGTAIGYSGIIMAFECIKFDGNLVTIEINKEVYEEARENFKKSKLTNITQIFGDAIVEVKNIEQKFDMIFIDAAKGKYKKFFIDSYEKLKENGIIVIDNILFRGYLYSEEFPKRYNGIVKKLDEFINYLYAEYDFTLLPFGDGVGIVRKIKEE